MGGGEIKLLLSQCAFQESEEKLTVPVLVFSYSPPYGQSELVGVTGVSRSGYLCLVHIQWLRQQIHLPPMH